MNKIIKQFYLILGIENCPVKHAERIASAVGGFIAILCIFVISKWFVGSANTGILIASMGASAVLLFAVPHGQLSQPWSVFGGHTISATIGVSCALWITNEILAASVAVGLAIGMMYYLRCIHPPGGATALAAVVGGEEIHNLGYQFVITPVLINVCIILVIAVAYNYLFEWRRYPISLHRMKKANFQALTDSEESGISHADFVYALSQVDSFIDVSEYDLVRIYDLATKQAKTRQLDNHKIKLGGYYSNGEYGDSWSVRHIIDESRHDDTEKDTLIYKVVVGHKRRTSATATRQEFARWAKYEVLRDEDNWKKVAD